MLSHLEAIDFRQSGRVMLGGLDALLLTFLRSK